MRKFATLRCCNEAVAPTSWGTGERAPIFTNGWARGTVSRRTANKKLTKLYWSLGKPSRKRLIVLLEPKKWKGTTETNCSGALRRTGAPTFVPAPLHRSIPTTWRAVAQLFLTGAAAKTDRWQHQFEVAHKVVLFHRSRCVYDRRRPHLGVSLAVLILLHCSRPHTTLHYLSTPSTINKPTSVLLWIQLRIKVGKGGAR